MVQCSKLDTPVCQVNAHTAIFSDLNKLDLALEFSHEEQVSFHLAAQSECGSDDGEAGETVSWNEHNLLDETVVKSRAAVNTALLHT